MNRYHTVTLIGLAAALAAANVVAAGNQTWPSTVVSLAGDDWKVAADPDNAGRDQAWWKGPVAQAKPVRVPGILQEALPGYHGVAWYWLEFTAPQNRYVHGRCLIRFHAVDYLAQVWLNDIPVGGHEGARHRLLWILPAP